MHYTHKIQYLIRNHRFEHFYLFNNVMMVYNNGIEVNAKWKLGDNESWLLGFCANNNYSIYGVDYSQQLLDDMVEQFDFSVFPNEQCFNGKKEIIDYLFNKNKNVKYNVIKDRIFYEVKKEDIVDIAFSNEIEICKANVDDLERLVELTCLFFVEEYKGENNKDPNEVRENIRPQIGSGKYLVAFKDGKIIGYITRMATRFDNDMIGTVYVDEENRGSKVGMQLVKRMTKEVLKDFDKCWLMTDMENIPSNKIMIKLGYTNIFEYSSGYISK